MPKQYLSEEDSFELFKPILADNIIFNNNFYNIYNDYLLQLSKKYKIDSKIIKKSFSNSLNIVKEDLYNNGFEMESLSTMFELLFYPTSVNWTLKNKTYQNYNINIDFFVGLKDFMFADEQKDLYFNIHDFKFTNRKLESFTLQSNAGLKYFYDENYKLKFIEFADKEMFELK